MGGRVPLVDLYVDERRFALSISKWSELHLRTLASRAHRGILHGMYGVNETEALRDGLRRAAGIRGACAAHGRAKEHKIPCSPLRYGRRSLD